MFTTVAQVFLLNLSLSPELRAQWLECPTEVGARFGLSHAEVALLQSGTRAATHELLGTNDVGGGEQQDVAASRGAQVDVPACHGAQVDVPVGRTPA